MIKSFLKNGPVLWETLLEAVDKFGAVVAGGCIRDFMLRLDPKDIDIFVPFSNRQEFEEFITELNTHGIFDLTLVEGEAYRTHDPDGIIGVAEGEGLGFPINIVARCAQMHEPGTIDNWNLINGFDFGILQWSFQSTKQGIVGTTQALMDLAGQQATLTHPNTYERSLERFERFTSRNPYARLLLVDPYALAF